MSIVVPMKASSSKCQLNERQRTHAAICLNFNLTDTPKIGMGKTMVNGLGNQNQCKPAINVAIHHENMSV